MKGLIAVVFAVAALTLAPKIASAQSVTIACEASNLCFSEASGVSYDTIAWTAETGNTGAIFPANCSNQNFCRFYCPYNSGFVTLTVTYRLSGQVVGSASARARCTAQDI